MDGRIRRLALADEVAPVSALHKPCPKTSFMFVNDTGQSQAFKVGTRPDIRSFIRKRQLKQVQETKLIRTEKERLLRPLAADVVDGTLAVDSSTEGDTREALVSCREAYITQGNTPRCSQRAKPQNRVVDKQRLQRPLGSSPLEILGAGRCDPFSTYPIEKSDSALDELMDYVITYFVPGLRPDDTSSTEVNSTARAWFKAGLTSPLLFHALAHAGSNHRDFMRRSQVCPNSTQTLSHKLRVLQLLPQMLGNGRTPPSDEIILSITLVSDSIVDKKDGKRNPFNSPLPCLRWLDVYGYATMIPEHKEALRKILALRGGVDKFELPGLVESFTGGDVRVALKDFSKPILPILPSHKNYIASLTAWAARQFIIPASKLASAFHKLDKHGITEGMLQVFDIMGALTLATDHYLQGKPAGLTLGQIGRTRNEVERLLLLLPSVEELDLSLDQVPVLDLYECCRWTAMIYGVAVVYPISDNSGLLQVYVARLKDAIEDTNLLTSSFQDGPISNTLLWALVLGGIAGLDKPEGAWFVTQLGLLIKRLKIDWDGVTEVLKTFLWLDSACDASGRLLWARVEYFASEIYIV